MSHAVSITDNGQTDMADLVYDFGTSRAILLYRGIYVMADMRNGAWELSSEPARPGQELTIHAQFVATVKTTTTITKDEP